MAKIVWERVVVTRAYAGNEGYSGLEMASLDGEWALRSKEVDLTALPLLQALTMECEVTARLFANEKGKSLSLMVQKMKIAKAPDQVGGAIPKALA